MRNEGDPDALTDALDEAVEAFNEEGDGLPTYEEDIETNASWKMQLTKGCKLLRAADTLGEQGQCTATIELCFGVIERSVEAYALAAGGDDLGDFHDHTYCYRRGAELGLLSRSTAGALRGLYSENRTDSYYGGKRPTREQAESLYLLAETVHDHVTEQIREGGVCLCG